MDMEDNKKIYLDKIIKWFVDDTIIDYEKGIIIYPFSPVGPTGKPLPSFIDDLKNRLSWGMPSDIQITCRDTYGLNYDETKYIWDNYKTIIKGRYNKESIMYDLKPINESVDNKKIYLDKIVNYLVDDTMVDQKNKVWYPPFPTDHSNPTFNHFYGLIPMTDHLELKFLIGNSYVRNFFNYCKDTYGLTDDKEIRKVWERYLKDLTPKIDGYSIINGIPTMNESEDKQKRYLDKIVDFLVYDTKMDYVKGKVWYPFMSDDINPFNFSPQTILTTEVPSPFEHYVNTTYFIDWDSTEYVWKKYISIMMDKYRSNNINESVDRKQDYLDKIVDFLVEDTDIGLGWFSPPYYYPGSTAGRTNFRSVYEHTFNLSSNTNYSGLDTQLIYFDHYCKNNYGLTGQENKIVWERYMKKLKETYKWGF